MTSWKRWIGAGMRLTYIGSISESGYLLRPLVLLAWIYSICLVFFLYLRDTPS